jgi:aromatic-L-amino-acid decarboxylase
MNWDDYAKWAADIAEWGRDYHKSIRELPVRAQTKPGDIAAQLMASAPETGHSMQDIWDDFQRIVLPGMTHWQHPRFFAYFPANATPPSMLAEQVVSIMAAQCMLWQTSPAATEMETKVLDWLRQTVGLPDGFTGVIQDSASGATLAAVLTMRERALNWAGNHGGLTGQPRLRIYSSDQVHTSIDRAVWISGIGGDNIVRVPTIGDQKSMDTDALRSAILSDLEDGYIPAGIIASVGGTGMGATDNIADVVRMAKEFDLYMHVDAAWAGSAMICPEFQSMWAGVDGADSIVFNPHKWLGVQFDCSAHYLKNPNDLVKTLAIQPEYLKTHGQDGFINYSEWSVPLGRRFRALKLWFMLRVYGMDELRARIRNHVTWAQDLAARLADTEDFEIVTKPILSLFTFRYAPKDAADLNDMNQRLVDAINDDGRIYITQTFVDGMKVIRFQVGQFDCTLDDINTAYDVICEIAKGLQK